MIDPVIRDLNRHFASIDYMDDVDRHIEYLERYQPEILEGLTDEQRFILAEEDLGIRRDEARIASYED